MRPTLPEQLEEILRDQKVTQTELGNVMGLTKGRISQILKGHSREPMAFEQAKRLNKKWGYSLEWLIDGTGEKKGAGTPARDERPFAKTAGEEMILELFRGLTREQQRELTIEVNATVAGNREIQTRFLNTPIKTFGNEQVEAAYGKIPGPKTNGKRSPKAKRRQGSAEDDPE